jgi:hypothetical protein
MRAPPTPSSLKWLINRRARLLGELSKLHKAEKERAAEHLNSISNLEKQHKEAIASNALAVTLYESSCRQFQEDVNAVDVVLLQHEVQIDPSLIAPMRTNENRLSIKHGQITRLIYESLKFAKGKTMTTTQVAIYISTKLETACPDFDFANIKYRIRQRLGSMASKGLINRHHSPVGAAEGRWSMSNDVNAMK